MISAKPTIPPPLGGEGVKIETFTLPPPLLYLLTPSRIELTLSIPAPLSHGRYAESKQIETFKP